MKVRTHIRHKTKKQLLPHISARSSLFHNTHTTRTHSCNLLFPSLSNRRQIVSGKSAFEHTGHRGGLTNSEKQRKKNFVMVRAFLLLSSFRPFSLLFATRVEPAFFACLVLCCCLAGCSSRCHENAVLMETTRTKRWSLMTGAEGEALRLLQAPRHAAGASFSYKLCCCC